MQPDLHLIAGGTGAGKTSYARVLALETGAMRFSIDDWMTTLFWMDSPQPIQFDWSMARIGRCEAQIRDQVQMLAELGHSAILDLGFTKADHRAAFGTFARDIGMRPVLHVLAIDPETRWARVQRRNAERGETYSMDVDRAMFDFMEAEWQAPDDGELGLLNGRVTL